MVLASRPVCIAFADTGKIVRPVKGVAEAVVYAAASLCAFLWVTKDEGGLQLCDLAAAYNRNAPIIMP